MNREKDYWIKRFEYLEKAQIENEEKYVFTLLEEYDKARNNIEQEIKSWFARFSVNNQISLQETKKWLNSKELDELKWDVNEYIKHGQENGIDLIWKKELENASAKIHISRLEALNLQIQQQIELLSSQEKKNTQEFIAKTYEDTFYTNAFEIQKGHNIAFDIPKLDINLINKIISKPWAPDEQIFSDRIWKNKISLINTLHTNLTQAIIRGDGPDEIIEKVTKTFNTSKNKAARLVMTESAFFSSASRKDCFNELGVKKYEIVATLDSHTSEICRELDGKIYDMKDYKPGITAPPFHVWCRSTTAPWFEDEFEFGERAARNTDGKTYYVPDNIKYNEWLEKYVNVDENIIENISGHLKNKNLKDITQHKEKIIDESFKNTTMRDIALNTNIKSIKTGGDKSYHIKGNVVLKNNYSHRTAIHEIGHAIDYNNNWLSSNKEFIKAIDADKKIILKNIDKYVKLIKDNKSYAGLSDIIGGMTDNKVVGEYKHKKSYWKQPNKLQRETFAQLFTMAGEDDLEQLEVIQKYLPNTFKAFDKLIGRLL